jgi:YD repeat-containing protein
VVTDSTCDLPPTLLEELHVGVVPLRVYFGSESGRVYSLRAGDGAVRWTYDAKGAVKCALALADGKLYFGDYSGRVYALHQADGTRSWSTGTKGSTFGFRSGQFYSTPAVAYGRVYIGNTDGRMYRSRR